MLFFKSDIVRTMTMNIEDRLEDGDVIFIAVPVPLFRRVARATGGWVNHVGIVFRNEQGDWGVYESTVPWARRCSLPRFLSRSDKQRAAIRRLRRSLTPDELTRMKQAAEARLGQPYHFGFNLDSRRQFCSKYVYEIYQEATGVWLGREQRFAELMKENPGHPLLFWRLWFFGRIPVNRRTVTPESLYKDEQMITVYEYQAGQSDQIAEQA